MLFKLLYVNYTEAVQNHLLKTLHSLIKFTHMQLKQVLWGDNKCQALTHPPRVHLPMTVHIMCKIKDVLSLEPIL